MRRFAVIFLASLALTVTSIWAQPTRVDILMVYTPAVKAFYGGEDGVLAHLVSVVEGSNAALANSQIPMVFHMVHAVETNYVESSTTTTDLDRLRMTSDGFMDEVHALRVETGADLVCLIRRGNATDAAGQAYVLSPTSPQFASGFSVVADIGALSNWTFAHEIGHNLSSRHDRPTNVATLSHAYGHRFVGSDGHQYRTVMATTSGWTRVPHFANPAVTFMDTPTGVPVGATEPADNALTFSISGPRVAAFCPQQSGAPRVIAESPGATVVTGSNVRLSPAVNGLPPVLYQWYRGQPGDISQPMPSSFLSIVLNGVNSPGDYWLSATNDEGTVSSRVVRVNVVPEPTGPFDPIATQSDSGTGYAVSPAGLTQDFVSSAGYLHEVRLGLFRQGTPPPIRVRLIAGNITLHESQITSAQLQTFTTEAVVAVRSFVNPGETLRIELTSDHTSVSGNGIFWAGLPNLTGTNPAFGSSNITGQPGWVFRFAAHGKMSAVYHAWLRGEGLRGSESDLLDRPRGPFPNLLLYAMAQNHAYEPLQFISSGSERRLRFVERRGMVDYQVVPERSTNLVHWSPVTWSARTVAAINGEQDQVELTLAPDDGTAAEFFRLRVAPMD